MVNLEILKNVCIIAEVYNEENTTTTYQWKDVKLNHKQDYEIEVPLPNFIS